MELLKSFQYDVPYAQSPSELFFSFFKRCVASKDVPSESTVLSDIHHDFKAALYNVIFRQPSLVFKSDLIVKLPGEIMLELLDMSLYVDRYHQQINIQESDLFESVQKWCNGNPDSDYKYETHFKEKIFFHLMDVNYLDKIDEKWLTVDQKNTVFALMLKKHMSNNFGNQYVSPQWRDRTQLPIRHFDFNPLTLNK